MRNEIGRPLTPARRRALAIAAVMAVGGPVAGGALTAQSTILAPTTPAFDVASIKLAGPGSGLAGLLERDVALMNMRLSPGQDGRFRTLQSPLQLLIQLAFSVQEFQIEGGPAWVRTDGYAVDARASAGTTPDQMRLMLRSLLADRFELMVRRQTLIRPVYSLVIAPGGPKIRAARTGDCVTPTPAVLRRPDPAPVYFCDGVSRRTTGWPPNRTDRIEAGAISMQRLIETLVNDVDRRIVDKTGFTEPFNVLLEFAPPPEPGFGPSDTPGMSIFAAIQEQLGLKLEPVEEPVEVLVIDRVERPFAN